MYAADLRLKVIAFAEQFNNSMTPYQFTMNQKQVSEWREKKSEFSLMSISKKDAHDQMAVSAAEEKLA